MKGCLCRTGLHPKTWHCIKKHVSRGGNFLADFPFGRPPTTDTGYWEKNEFHRIKNWGKKHG